MAKGKTYIKPKYEKPLRFKKSDWSLLKFNPFKGGGILRTEKYSIYFDKTNKEYYYGKQARSRNHKVIRQYSDVSDAYDITQMLNNKRK